MLIARISLVALLVAAFGCGDKSGKTKANTRSAAAKSGNAIDSDKIEIVVPLFDPKDLEPDLEGIVDHMTAFRFSMTPSGDCEAVEHVGPLNASSANFTTQVGRKCSYTAILEYGHGEEGAGEPAKDTSASYLAGVKPLLDAKCATAGCHSSSGPYPSLASFDGAKTLGAKIVNRANGVGGSIMPPAGKLSDTELALLKAWQDAGFTEGGTALTTAGPLKMGEIFYNATAPLAVKETDFEGNRLVSLLFKMGLTEEGKTLGLSVREIQGKSYKRGQAVVLGEPKKPDESTTDGDDETEPMPTEMPGNNNNTMNNTMNNNNNNNNNNNTPAAVTFDKVQALFGAGKGNCSNANCHPGAYKDYASIAGAKEAILDQVVARKRMPKAGGGQLSDSERTLIESWIDGGAKPAAK